MNLKLLSLILTFSLLLVTGCGSDDDDDDTPTTTQRETEEPASQFSTRLSRNLAFSGERCNGGEDVDSPEGSLTVCPRDRWLIQIDDANTCSPDLTTCTEIGVYPILADLKRADVVSAPEYTFYRIVPEMPVTASQRRAINSVWVRVDMNGGTEVVRR